MIILIRKHNILTACLVLVVAYLAYSFVAEDIVPTVILPVTNKVVVIDPGHGGHDPGAVGKNGLLEKNVNLDIALKLQAFLEQSGCVVQLTRAVDESIHDTDERSLRNKKRSDLKKRREIVDTSEADAFISIHLNSFSQPKYKGVQTFYPKESLESKRLAESVQNELKTTLEIVDNRVALPINNIYLLKDVKIPSIIVECGFLSNPEEEKKLATDGYRRQIAWGIYMGIMKFFEQLASDQ